MQNTTSPGPIISEIIVSSQPKALYFGSDTRVNVSNIENLEGYSTYIKSVACLILSDHLHPLVPEKIFDTEKVIPLAKWVKNRYGYKYGDESFKKEPVAGFGTAFLVGPRHMLTAAHCVCQQNTSELDQERIKKTYIVFDFTESKGIGAYRFSERQIYTIQRVVDHVIKKGNIDWALLELDRDVENRPALPIEWSQELPEQTSVYMLGHSNGLPMKFVKGLSKPSSQPDQAENEIREFHIDAFAGNSGSPVIKSDTHSVVGILVNGSADYDVDEKNREVRLHKVGPGYKESEKCQAFLPQTRLSHQITILCSQDPLERSRAANALANSILVKKQKAPNKILGENQLNRAAKLFEQAFTQGGILEAGYNQGYCLYNLEQKEEALAVFNQLSQKQLPEEIQQATQTYIDILNQQGYVVLKRIFADQKAEFKAMAALGGQVMATDNKAFDESQMLNIAFKGGNVVVEESEARGSSKITAAAGVKESTLDDMLREINKKKE